MSDSQPSRFGPYEPVRRAGDLYFVSGQVGVDPESKVAGVNVAAQTHQVFQNLATVLRGAGLALGDVVKTTVYLTDMGDFAEVNDIYLEYFETPRPARACVAVKELPRVGGEVGLRVEIEAVAMKGAE